MVKAEWLNGVKSSAGRQVMAGCQVIGLGKTSEVVNNTHYSLFTNPLTHCPHPKSLSQKGRGTLRGDRIISEQAV